jgi:crossover junction endonuclease EME1
MFLDRSFCMDVGQIKSGTGTEDTFHKMLQQVHRVTPQVADSIMARYKSVHALIRGFQQGGPSTLEDLPVTLNLSGC